MSKCKELLDRMPKTVMLQLNQYKHDYKMTSGMRDGREYLRHNEIRSEASAYTTGLRDAGLVTDRERMLLFIYTT